MKLHYAKQNKKDFRQINFYQKESEKKQDTKDNLFLNIALPKEPLTRMSFIRLVRLGVRRAILHKQEKISFSYQQLRDISQSFLDKKESAFLSIMNIIRASYSFDTYKTHKDYQLKEILIFGDFSKIEKKAMQEAEIVASNINMARDLANTPGNNMTPSILARTVKTLFKKAPNTKVKILKEKDIKKLKMNLMEAVGRASKEESQFIIVEYINGKKNEKPTVIVGKGVTFDAGGLDIKPAGKFLDMYMDMTGAAIGIGTLKSLVDLKIKKNVILLIPAVENFVSAQSYRPGDIITSLSGKTVAIGHTDAEGRLVMADAISYGERYKPSLLIDIATLTGASLVALGQRATAIMSQTPRIQEALVNYGDTVGERLWPLPTWNEFASDLKSDYADISNIGKTRYGGTITAGMFLYEFIKMYKKEPQWVHLDIAPRMESIEEDNLAKGATGEPIAMLVEFFKNS